MTNIEFGWQTDEFMMYCRSRQRREKTMNSYEQLLRLFHRGCQKQAAGRFILPAACLSPGQFYMAAAHNITLLMKAKLQT